MRIVAIADITKQVHSQKMFAQTANRFSPSASNQLDIQKRSRTTRKQSSPMLTFYRLNRIDIQGSGMDSLLQEQLGLDRRL